MVFVSLSLCLGTLRRNIWSCWLQSICLVILLCNLTEFKTLQKSYHTLWWWWSGSLLTCKQTLIQSHTNLLKPSIKPFLIIHWQFTHSLMLRHCFNLISIHSLSLHSPSLRHSVTQQWETQQSHHTNCIKRNIHCTSCSCAQSYLPALFSRLATSCSNQPLPLLLHRSSHQP